MLADVYKIRPPFTKAFNIRLSASETDCVLSLFVASLKATYSSQVKGVNASGFNFFWNKQMFASMVSHSLLPNTEPIKLVPIFFGFIIHRTYTACRLSEVIDWLSNNDIPACAYPLYNCIPFSSVYDYIVGFFDNHIIPNF